MPRLTQIRLLQKGPGRVPAFLVEWPPKSSSDGDFPRTGRLFGWITRSGFLRPLGRRLIGSCLDREGLAESQLHHGRRTTTYCDSRTSWLGRLWGKAGRWVILLVVAACWMSKNFPEEHEVLGLALSRRLSRGGSQNCSCPWMIGRERIETCRQMPLTCLLQSPRVR